MTTEDKAKLVLEAVRTRFLSTNIKESNGAIITAIEGLKWIAGQESAINEEWLHGYLEDNLESLLS